MANSTFLEKTLEDIIYNAPQLDLAERGLQIKGTLKRQLKIGNYGIADIVSFERHETLFVITVYELKKDKVDANTVMQAFRYCKGISRYLKHRKFKGEVYYKVVVIGSDVCSGDFVYLTDFLANVTVLTYSYEFDGISFNEHHKYFLREEGF